MTEVRVAGTPMEKVGDMRGARRELGGHEAPARPLDNQVL